MSALVVLLLPVQVASQQDSVRVDPVSSDTVGTVAGWGAELAVPLFSVPMPGLGQYVHGAGWAGAGHTGVWLAGLVGASGGDLSYESTPRDPRSQFATEALHVAVTAGALSAWDAFHRAVPNLQEDGKYEFLSSSEGLGDLLTAPIDPEFLGRWTTWVNLGLGATVAAIVASRRNRGVQHETFAGHDAAYVASLSYNAAVGEEALFRGWMLPVFRQKLGGHFWAGNSLQAVLFGAGHVPQSDWFAATIGGFALYQGWLTRRNQWSVRESIFGHFWYDVFVATAQMLRDPRGTRVSLPAITIRF